MEALSVNSLTKSPLLLAINDIRSGAVDETAFLSMSNISLIAATSALHRAQNASNMGRHVGGKGTLKRSRARTSGILAMTAARYVALYTHQSRNIFSSLEGTLTRFSSLFEARLL